MIKGSKWHALFLAGAMIFCGCGPDRAGSSAATDSLGTSIPLDAQGISALNDRLRANPHDRAALVERAARYLDLGRPANALADWDRAAALQPLSATERLTYAGVRLALGQHADALDAYAQALADAPDRSLYYNARGTVLMAQGDHAAADKALDTALRINPRFADAWHNKGTALYELRKLLATVKGKLA